MKIVIFILILTLLLMFTPLLAENHMDLMCEFEGENPEDQFGTSMCNLDFNGDGIDDLAVGSKYNPDGVGRSYGRVYFYFGGDDFDDIPDLTVTGNNDNLLDLQLKALGDLNNDGFDDIGMPNYNDNGIPTHDETWILFGGSEPDTIPDYIFHIPIQSNGSMPAFNALGDVNNDGYDDVGICNDLNQYYIIWGGDTLRVELFYEYDDVNREGRITGIGDVNNDGFDDIEIGLYYDQYTQSYRDLLFYGGDPPDTLYDVLLADTANSSFLGGKPTGDVNDDGYDDFYSCVRHSVGLWLGREVISPHPHVYLDYEGIGGASDYGDFNNDGYSDAALGNPSWNWYDGRVHIILGGTYINGATDLFLNAPEISNIFGNAIAVGDFNNDGYDDAAIGAPGTWTSPDTYPGKVYVYAGNDSLTVGVDDPDLPDITDTGSMHAYPNPFSSEIHFHLNVRSLRELTIQIYNVKGQLIETVHVQERDMTWQAKDNPSGAYFCKLMYKNEVLEVAKVILVKP